jgi:hypothetical protein
MILLHNTKSYYQQRVANVNNIYVHEQLYKNNSDIGFYDFGKEMYKGVECYHFKSFSKDMRDDGGTGTIDPYIYVEINTGRIWSS